MKKIIFVNATSATNGGTLTILNQFIEQINLNKDINKVYYIFVPKQYEDISNKFIKIIHVKAKKYIDRIKWDIYLLKKWSKNNNLKPDLIISLQNTGVYFNNINQIIYLHQALPYSKESSWSLFKKDERKMWFYKNIYKIWINLTIKKSHKVVVQAEWMKNEIIKHGYLEKNLIISKPSMTKINTDKIKPINLGKKYFFYPAADYKYKNHEVLIKAIDLLEKTKKNLEEFKIIFTLTENSYIYSIIKKRKLERYFLFIGNIKYDEVLSYYKGCQAVVFPSYIESFGLPLIEAQSFRKKIIAADCEYSREVLNGYDNVEFINHNNYIQWASIIQKSIEEDVKECKEIIKNHESDIGWTNIFTLIERLT